MGIDRSATRWNGWGWSASPNPLETRPAVWAALARALGSGELPTTPSATLASVRIPPARLGTAARADLERFAGGAGVKDDHASRVRNSVGSSYPDLLQLRSGVLPAAIDAVVAVQDEGEIVPVLEWAARHDVAVIPRGGGTSVVGGVTASAADARPVVALDLTGLARLIDVDRVSLLATAQAGIDGPALEAALSAHGLTLGHAPQSFEFSTLGGWIAARGAGHQSGRYGKAEDWFVGGSVATPRGTWTITPFPASSTGPDLRALVAGSEGALGVLTHATVRVRPLPQATDYRAWLFPDFAAGADAVRQLQQSGLPLATVRLSDADEVVFLRTLQTAGHPPTLAARLRTHALSALGVPDRPCLLILGAEGTPEEVAEARRGARRVCRASGGVRVGTGPAQRWYEGRFRAPYLRDPLLDRGLGVDTLETATSWRNMLPLHAGVTSALHDAMDHQTTSRGLVLGHLSHAYADGASLYFTYVFCRDDGRALEQWHAIKSAVTDAIVRLGGTLSHHHGIGRDHAAWLASEKGELGMDVLRAIKRALDPTGVLNPGVLIPTDSRDR